ncbi:uncharacterized protein LOC113331835 isoform X2 [Papaver somniferum]|uniref:uncharacterized protein LOC113331835 isoform X2 n=1 Tax=Papaver somniferum TaxID=3469 RepID=UPI000E70332E|nr:uncharacterized protein LOC113331835 isoform X2 [Papaver somniferum]
MSQLVMLLSGKGIKGCRADFGLIHGVVAAEEMALILACSWVGEMNLSRVLFISDCLQLMDLVNQGKGDIDWRSQDLVEDCRISFPSCVNSRIVFIKRSKNKITDRLARRAKKFSLKNTWNSSPHFLQSIMREEPLTDICNDILF